MFAPRGFGQSELGKFDVFSDGERLHLFALTLPNHDVVIHASSEDGLAWRMLPNALATGNPGACDDDEIWSVSVAERDGRYAMLYTALARAEDGLVQRTALATSDDLLAWQKVPGNPVAEADERWYAVGPHAAGRVSWRDPKPVRIGDTYYAPLCAHERAGPLLRRGCVGLLSSPDLIAWEARPPLFAPRRSWDLECPQVFTVEDAWYLTASVSEDRTQRYWIAPDFTGPYTVPADGGALAPTGYYAGRVCHWDGLDLLFCQVTAEIDRKGFARRAGKFVAAPLVLTRRANGRLSRRSYPGWAAYRTREPQPLRPESQTRFHEQPAGGDGEWRVQALGRMDVLASTEPLAAASIAGQLLIDAEIGGIVLGLDDLGGGYFVELRDSTSEIALKQWRAGPLLASDRPFRYAELQRTTVPTLADHHEPLPFSVLVIGTYIECSLMGEVVLAAHSSEPIRGRFGLWAEGGIIAGVGIAAAPMRMPEHA